MASGPNGSHPAKVAEYLLSAHQSGHRVAVNDDALNLARADAMSVQGLVAKGLKADVHAWKVAVMDGTPAYAPMFDAVVKPSGSEWTIPDEGVHVEIELALRLKAAIPPRPEQPYTREEIEAAVGELIIGIELVGSRFQKSPGAAPLPAWLADSLGNAAYFIGDGIPFISGVHASALRCRFWADEVVQLDHVGGHPQGDVITPLLLNANAQTDIFGGFKAGDVITTGCLHKPALHTKAVAIKATIDGVGNVEVLLV